MKNQEFKTLDIVLLMTLVVVVGAVCTSIVTQGSSQTDDQRAIRRAENISLQLMNLSVSKFQQKPDKNFRGLASLQTVGTGSPRAAEKNLGPEGKIGQDPWGNPYRYKFIEDENGDWSYLVIWSPGPDLKAETHVEDWTFEKVSAKPGIKRGPKDDLALIKALR